MFVAEREVAAHRLDTWRAALTVFAETSLDEEVLSLEPPWRRVAGRPPGPVEHYETTFAIQDRGPGCLFVYSGYMEVEAEGELDAEAEAYIAAEHAAAEAVADDIVAALGAT